MEDRKVKIIVDTSEKPYFYVGFIQKELNGYIYFLDDRVGEILINKNKLISIKQVGE